MLPSPVELKQRFEAERGGRPFMLYRDENGAQRIFELLEVGQRRRPGPRLLDVYSRRIAQVLRGVDG